MGIYYLYILKAEGMTLGLAFRKAGVNKTTSTYMILI